MSTAASWASCARRIPRSASSRVQEFGEPKQVLACPCIIARKMVQLVVLASALEVTEARRETLDIVPNVQIVWMLVVVLLVAAGAGV